MKRLPSLSFLPRLGGRRASFKIGVIATLAIAVGANIAVLGNLGVLFGRVVPGASHHVLLSPYLQPAQQVMPESFLGVPRPVYDRLYKEVGKHVRVGAFKPYTLSYKALSEKGGGSSSGNVNFIKTTPSLVGVLGIHAMAGRLLMAQDSKLGAKKVALVSEAFARSHFGSATGALNQRIMLGRTDYRVVGVLPADLVFPPNNPASAWVVLPSETSGKQGKAEAMTGYFSGLQLLVNPSPGWSAARLKSVLASALQQALAQAPAGTAAMVKSMGFEPEVQSYARKLYGPIITKLELLELAALLLFVLVLANLAGLATADTLARRHEFAARAALGASALRLYAEHVRELIFLGIIGWAIGVGLGWLGSHALIGVIGHAGPAVVLSVPVLLLTLSAVLIVMVLLAAGGVWRVHAPSNLLADLMGGGRTTGGKGLVRTLRALIVLQLVVSVILLIVAGHFRANVATLSSRDLGFNPRHLIFAQPSLSELVIGNGGHKSGSVNITFSANGQSTTAKKLNAKALEILSRLRAAPGVEVAAVLSTVPLSGSNTMSMRASVGGRPTEEVGGKAIGVQTVSRGVIKTLGMTVLAGDPDAIFQPASSGIFIDVRTAHQFFPALSPRQVIGKTLHIVGPGKTDYRIEAVVSNLKVKPYTASKGQVYKSFRTRLLPLTPTFAVRTRIHGKALRKLISDAVKTVYPTNHSMHVNSAKSLIAKAYAKRIRLGRVFGVLAVVALLIAAVGLFALLAYRSLVRRPEFAIRGALGATPGRLLGNVLGEATALWIIGCVIGVPAAYGLSIVLASYLPKLGLPAAWVAVAVVVALGLTALVAAFIPARRAAGTDLSGNLSA